MPRNVVEFKRRNCRTEAYALPRIALVDLKKSNRGCDVVRIQLAGWDDVCPLESYGYSAGVCEGNRVVGVKAAPIQRKTVNASAADDMSVAQAGRAKLDRDHMARVGRGHVVPGIGPAWVLLRRVVGVNRSWRTPPTGCPSLVQRAVAIHRAGDAVAQLECHPAECVVQPGLRVNSRIGGICAWRVAVEAASAQVRPDRRLIRQTAPCAACTRNRRKHRRRRTTDLYVSLDLAKARRQRIWHGPEQQARHNWPSPSKTNLGSPQSAR